MRGAALLPVALLLLAGCTAAPCERPPVRLQFLLVNDVYDLDPRPDGRGGLARVATLVRGLRPEADHTLFALAGDTLSPSLLSSVLHGRQMIDAWNALGLDVATFGNHEFDWGLPVLLARMRESRFRWVSSNVRERATGRPLGGAEAWLGLDWSGVRVGVIGLTTPDTARTSSPGPEVRFDPPGEAARETFARMGAVDLRVGLTHLPIRADREVARTAGLHLVLGGHDHDPMLERDGETVIVKAGADAVHVGRVGYVLGCGGQVLRRSEELLPVDARVPGAPDVTALVERYAALLERELDVPVGQTPIALDVRDTVIRREPTPLGRFLAQVMRERVGAEVGLLNGGAVRANRVIPAGPLTRRDLHRLLPFGNVVVLLELTGAELLEALEHSVDALPRPAGHYLQTAGLLVDLEPAGPVGRRVRRVLVGDRPLAPGARYRVAVPDYLARGKDGYAGLARARVLLGPEDGPGLVGTVEEALARGRSPE